MADPILDSQTPEYHRIQQAIRVAEKRLGRSIGWNGAIEVEPGSGPGRLRDGTMVVSEQSVVTPLRTLREQPEPTAEQAERAVEAIANVARITAATASVDPATDAIDQELAYGAADMWSLSLRADLASDTGLTAYPSVAGLKYDNGYRVAYFASGGADGLIGRLAAASKLRNSAIAIRILTADPGERWRTIADIGLDLRLSGDDRTAACQHLGDQLRDEYAGLLSVVRSSMTAQEKFDQGVLLGRAAAERLVERMDRIEPTSSDYLFARDVIRAVERRTGLPTRWNGRIYPESDPALGGTVHGDNTMTLSETHVSGPIRTAYQQQGSLTEQQARDAVWGVHLISHETTHAAGPHWEVVDGQVDPADQALEEGLADLWPYRNRSSVIQDIGMDQDVPAIAPYAAADMVSYPAYYNAAAHLVDGAAELSGQDSDKVLELLVGTRPGERWGLLADLALDKHLPGLPEDRRQVLRQELVAQMRQDYAPALALQKEAKSPSRPMDEIRADARQVGKQTVAGVAERIRIVQEQQPDAPAGQEIQRLHSAVFDGNAPAARTADGPVRSTDADAPASAPGRPGPHRTGQAAGPHQAGRG